MHGGIGRRDGDVLHHHYLTDWAGGRLRCVGTWRLRVGQGVETTRNGGQGKASKARRRCSKKQIRPTDDKDDK